MVPFTKNYSFIKKIGQGSYGEVWLVKHKDYDHKKFVLKKISFARSSDREMDAARLECQLLKSLEHPNIVQYKDSFEENNSLYIAMAFCEGGDLYTRLKERKGLLLCEKQIIEWLIQITMALSYIHERNILHRDLKTQNIFLTKSIIKIGDLGIAKQLESKYDMAQTVIGTPYYMSPELFEKKPYNFKSDIWSLGCVTYEMATLKHAFNAKNYTALSYKILMGQTPDMPSKYSKELINLMQAMLNKSPEKRPSTGKILCNTFIRENIHMFVEQSKRNFERSPRHRKTSLSKNIPLEFDKESCNSEDKSPGIKISGIPDESYEKLKTTIATLTLKNHDNEYDDNDDVIVVHSSNDSHSKKSSNSSSKENQIDSRKSSKTDLEIEFQKGTHNSEDKIVTHSNKQGRSQSFSCSDAVASEVNQPEITKESSNRVAREKRRQMKREQGLQTLRNPSAICDNNLDVKNENDNKSYENDSNHIRNKRRKNNLFNQNGNGLPLPELRRIDIPENIQNEKEEITSNDVFQVVEKMNETLNINEKFNNMKDSIMLYRAQKIHNDVEPIEDEQETLDRSKLMNKRYQEIRKELMTTIGYKNLAMCFEILRDLNLNHEVKIREILGDDYDRFCGKVIWLKMIEEA